MQAVIYLRQSLDKTGEQLGVQRQEAECRRLCHERGWTVQDVVTDNSVSASRGTRAGYEQVLSALERRTVDVVVVYRLDRLLRRMADLEALVDVVERTGTQIATVQGDLDLTNSSGRLLARILASVARAEIETKSERHMLANEQKARAGLPHGSRRAYGYEADLVTINEPEAAVLRQMAERVLAGHSYKEVAYWLNEQGRTTTFGKPWYPITVRNMLRKKRYGGIREYKGAEYPAKWPAVFDAETWRRLQLTMRLRARPTDAPVARKYLLTGLANCGRCGAGLNGATKRDHANRPLRRTYNCKQVGCGGVVRNADALEHFVAECVLYRLNTPKLDELLQGGANDANVRDLLDRRLEVTNRVDELVDDYGTGLLTRDQLGRAKSAAEAELQRLDAELDRLATPLGGLGSAERMRAAWNESPSVRREVLRLLIHSIEVRAGISKPVYMVNGKAMRFDPSLVNITWRV